jgi:hypothetical protein
MSNTPSIADSIRSFFASAAATGFGAAAPVDLSSMFAGAVGGPALSFGAGPAPAPPAPPGPVHTLAPRKRPAEQAAGSSAQGSSGNAGVAPQQVPAAAAPPPVASTAATVNVLQPKRAHVDAEQAL